MKRREGNSPSVVTSSGDREAVLSDKSDSWSGAKAIGQFGLALIVLAGYGVGKATQKVAEVSVKAIEGYGRFLTISLGADDDSDTSDESDCGHYDGE
jgi:hypothetical protein